MKNEMLLCGYYGFQNTGDDAFCVVGAWGNSVYWGANKLYYSSSTLPVLANAGIPALPQKKSFKGQRLLAMVLASIRSDDIVYLGGSVFDRRPSFFEYSFFHNQYMHYSKKRISAVGVSLGPFKNQNDKQWVKDFLDKFSFISFRDSRSYELAMEMNIKAKVVNAFDLAVLLPLIPSNTFPMKSEQDTDYVLGVSVCNYERYVGKSTQSEDLREKRILEVLKLLSVRHKLKVRLFIFNNDSNVGDAEITYKYKEALKNFCNTEIINYSADPLHTFNLIKQCDGFLGVRLHSAIFAYTANIPFVLVEYHPKCTDFLNDIGYNKNLRMPAELYESSEAIQKIEEALFERERNSLYQLSLEEAQAKSILNFTEAPWHKSKL